VKERKVFPAAFLAEPEVVVRSNTSKMKLFLSAALEPEQLKHHYSQYQLTQHPH